MQSCQVDGSALPCGHPSLCAERRRSAAASKWPPAGYEEAFSRLGWAGRSERRPLAPGDPDGREGRPFPPKVVEKHS